MRYLRVLLSSLLVAAALPAAAGAHGPVPGEDHRATDLTGVSVTTQEREARAIERELGRRPGDAPKPASGERADDFGVTGRWSAVEPAPVVPIFEALLPNGKVLMWDSVGDNPAESYDDHTFTRAAVYDPVTKTSKRVDVAGANIFCAGYVQLANGNVFVAGGNADRNLAGIRKTHTFDWRSETWSRGPDMQDGRWYPSVAAMPNDEAVIVGGGPTVAEVRTSTGGLRRTPGVSTISSRSYPFLQTNTDGRALMLGTFPGMQLIDTAGAGAIEYAGQRDAIDRDYGAFAPYDIGRFLVTGGGWVNEDGRTNVPSRTATKVDTRSGDPVASPTGSMSLRRRQASLTVLADGTVLATGGQSTTGGGGLVDLANATYAAELWKPGTGIWTRLASATVARQYHSTALLLPDARVLTGGGGVCGVCHQVGYLRRDTETFTPPYLYRRDGSGALAPRPEISSAPASIDYDAPFTITSPQAHRISKLALVRLGAPTHGVDQSQRYVPVGFSVSGTTLTVAGPNNPNEAPAGHYMLFAVDADGVPSVAPIVQVIRPVVPTAAMPVNLALRKPSTGSTPCRWQESPAKAVNGSVSGGTTDKWCSSASNRFLQVDLGSSHTVSRFVVKHAGSGGEKVHLNTRGFRIETSTNGSSWSAATTVTQNSASVSSHSVSSRTARYVRLVVTAGHQGSVTGSGRIYEFEVYRPATVVPVAPVVAYGGVGFTAQAQAFEAGAYDLFRGNLGQVGNDAMRSIEVSSGFTATICRDPGIVNCTTLAAGRHSSLPAGFEGATSSLRVQRG